MLEDQANNYSWSDLDPFFSDIDGNKWSESSNPFFNVESYCTDTEDNESLFLITPNIQNSTELHFEVASNYYGECEITIAADDGTGQLDGVGTSPATFTVFVDSENDPVTSSSISDYTFAEDQLNIGQNEYYSSDLSKICRSWDMNDYFNDIDQLYGNYPYERTSKLRLFNTFKLIR